MEGMWVNILLARMLRLDRTAPRISSARKLVPFLALPNGTSDILAVAPRPQLLGGLWAGRAWARPGWLGRKVPESSHKSLAGHPPPQVREEEGASSSSTRMRVVMTMLLAICLLSACGIIMIGEPVKHQDLSSEDEAEENLKAIRAMLRDHASHPPDEKSSGASTQPLPPDPTPSLSEPSSSLRPAPSASSSAARTDAPAKLPWTPSPPDRPTIPDRPVPAYTVPAPVGPDYSGSIRCAPDGMGGQRCVGR
jgi:hypothetical protein